MKAHCGCRRNCRPACRSTKQVRWRGSCGRTLLEFPEVSYAITQLGRNDDGTDPWTPSHIEAPVGLKPYNTWPKGETREDFLRRVNARLKQLKPGFSIGISQPIIDMVYDVIGGAHSPLVIRVFGDDFQELRRIGGDIVKVLDGIRGTAEASIFQEPPIPQIAIDIDRAAAARYGINVSDITALIQTGVGGASVSKVYVNDRTVRRYRAVSERLPQQPGGAGQPGAHHIRRSADSAIPGCQYQTSERREHHHA